MSTLNAASTDAQVWQAYDDNSSYEEDGNAAKAAAFITACRILLRRRPTQMTQAGGRSIAFDAMSIREERLRASRWLAANGGGQVDRYIDVSDIRC
jgi:hypothetical protein